ncbi:MAG: hypothetical protein HUJ56_10455, partial [Erysipelotrichaceae bacterium]|nr:hypothetical protein [Erysipelotrichaceae bacterium]
ERIVPTQSFPTRTLIVNEVEEVVEEVKADVSEDKMTEESEAAPVEQTVGAVVSEIVQEVTSITLLDLAMLSIVGAMVGLVSSVAMMKNFYNR